MFRHLRRTSGHRLTTAGSPARAGVVPGQQLFAGVSLVGVGAMAHGVPPA